MHRGKYAIIKVRDNSEIIRKISTNEIFEKEITLYDYTADENNIYYDFPILDDPSDYEFVNKKTHQTLNIKTYLEYQNFYKFPYLVITDLTKILGCLSCYVEPCSKFFAIRVLPEVANFIERFGYDKFYIKSVMWQTNLLNLAEKSFLPYLKGTEILLFIDTDDLLIREQLNFLRLYYIKANAKIIFENYRKKFNMISMTEDSLSILSNTYDNRLYINYLFHKYFIDDDSNSDAPLYEKMIESGFALNKTLDAHLDSYLAYWSELFVNNSYISLTDLEHEFPCYPFTPSYINDHIVGFTQRTLGCDRSSEQLIESRF